MPGVSHARRPAIVFPPRDQRVPWSIDERLLRPSKDYPAGYQLVLVNLLPNGQMHDCMPDFIIRLKSEPPVHLILETKGYDPLEGTKAAAAQRWTDAVNADGPYGEWRYVLVHKTTDVPAAISKILQEVPAAARN